MSITGSRLSSNRVAAFIGTVSLAAGCVEKTLATLEVSPTPLMETASPAGAASQPAQAPPALPRLIPPTPFVFAPDGVTPKTLEEAGILNPDGQRWAVALGKALFWDQQAGSDGNACASCHFHAGADTRLRNQLNPGLNDVTKRDGNGDVSFGSERSDTGAVLPGRMPSGAVAGPNYVLQPEDMPLHRLEFEANRDSRIVTTTNDRVSSLGSFDAAFVSIGGPGEDDRCGPANASVFHAGWSAARQAEPRNTPTFHNAAFNFRNFWDNRANNLFNGVGAFGMRDVVGDPSKPTDPRNSHRLIVIENGAPALGYLKVENASLASQAVAPPASTFEMSCAGRRFVDIGKKLLASQPLAQQPVSAYDSVLGPYAARWGGGLEPQYHYAALIMKAFTPKYWSLSERYTIVDGKLVKDPRGFTQMEINFSMFWGLAIEAYESTTISDQSEFDALQAAGRLVMAPSFAPAGPGIGRCTSPTGDVDELLLRGCTIFSRLNPGVANPENPPPAPPDGVRGGNCFVCHNAQGGGVGRPRQPLLAEGAIQNGEPFSIFLTVGDVNNRNDLRDQGSANIGLRPVFSDLMSGRTDPYGNPLSFGRQLWSHLDGHSNAVLDPPLQRAIAANAVPRRVDVTQPTPPNTFRKLEADGSTKAPILRNVALTPPYFSWGGYPNLRQVLKVYNRGMNRRTITASKTIEAHGSDCTEGDDTGTGADGNHGWPIHSTSCDTNTTGLIQSLGLSDCDADGAPNKECLARGQSVANDDLAALERFLKSLTDPRVQCDQAPFDHPALRILDGHDGNGTAPGGRASDVVFTLPAVGAEGYSPSSGLCIPNAGDLFAPGMQARSGGRPSVKYPTYEAGGVSGTR